MLCNSCQSAATCFHSVFTHFMMEGIKKSLKQACKLASIQNGKIRALKTEKKMYVYLRSYCCSLLASCFKMFVWHTSCNRISTTLTKMKKSKCNECVGYRIERLRPFCWGTTEFTSAWRGKNDIFALSCEGENKVIFATRKLMWMRVGRDKKDVNNILLIIPNCFWLKS